MINRNTTPLIVTFLLILLAMLNPVTGEWCTFHQNNQRTGTQLISGDEKITIYAEDWRYITHYVNGITYPPPGIFDVNGDDQEEIFSTDDGGYIYSIDSNGELIWETTLDDHLGVAPTIGDTTGDGSYEVVVGKDQSSGLYGLDALDGSEIWSTSDAGRFVTIVNIDDDDKMDIISVKSDGGTKDGIIAFTIEKRFPVGDIPIYVTNELWSFADHPTSLGPSMLEEYWKNYEYFKTMRNIF